MWRAWPVGTPGWAPGGVTIAGSHLGEDEGYSDGVSPLRGGGWLRGTRAVLTPHATGAHLWALTAAGRSTTQKNQNI